MDAAYRHQAASKTNAFALRYAFFVLRGTTPGDGRRTACMRFFCISMRAFLRVRRCFSGAILVRIEATKSTP